ncbi:MAG: hypothetical protein H6983_17440 [Ectothiorhodospiraceae bacterium]|nr:hypothetical protein [Chromatiales bacterium]MCP5155959.1 hypothetical protein [Ectothiorhodospiraceae bacterium]
MSAPGPGAPGERRGARERVLWWLLERAVDDVEREHAAEFGQERRLRTAPQRLRPLLEVLGALILAANVATVALVLNFFVFAKVLHFAF